MGLFYGLWLVLEREALLLFYNRGLLCPLCREADEEATHRLTTIENRKTAYELILMEWVYI